LAEHLEVTSAVLKDGVLKVDMKLNLPEEKKPKTITVK
jgi:HSP20 family molecular chaperone IbpA